MKYAGIINNDVVNGYDVCVSYWCQGCRFRCPGCQNPQTWDFSGGIDIEEDTLIQNILSAIHANGIMRNFSILGGEPMCDENVAFTKRLVQAVKGAYPDIMIFVWTGYKLEDLMTYYGEHSGDVKYVLDNIDVIIDGQFDLSSRDITLPFRGSKNQRVIDMKMTEKSGKVINWRGKTFKSSHK